MNIEIKEIKEIGWFKSLLWHELKRYNSQLKKERRTVTCTEDNINNLFNSQFSELTVYGEVFYYSQ